GGGGGGDANGRARRPRAPSMRLLVATVWAYPGRPLEDSPLWQSCRRLGVPLFVSQFGRPFHSFYQNKVLHLLHDLRREAWDVVLYADGDDAFLTRHPREAVEVLGAYGAGFVVGGEADCWPTPGRHAHRYPAGARAAGFPNAGVWAATREDWE